MTELGERFIYRGRPQTLRTLLRMVTALWATHGDLVVTARPASESGSEGRTGAQNRYLHAAIGQIAKHAGSDPETTKMWLKKEAYGEKCFLYNGEPVYRLVKTSKLSKKQMVHFIEFCLHHAAENGYPVLMPPEYEHWKKEV